MVVGHAHFIAFDRVRHGNGGVLEGRTRATEQGAQISRHRRCKVGMLGTAQAGRVREQSGRSLHREAGISATDVGQQSRDLKRHHGSAWQLNG